MSTDREQLIEEAAKASARARRGVTAKVNESDRRATEAALTVLEKAHTPSAGEHFHIWSDVPCKPGQCRMEPHTPTGDEREARDQKLCERCGWALSGHVRSQYGLDCPPGGVRPGFSRTVQGEPSVRVAVKPAIDAARKVVEGLEDWEIQPHAAQEILSALGDIPDCESWTAVPHAEHVQGEPSDVPSVQFVARAGGKTQELVDRMLAQASERGIRVEVVYPQGEPSDAAVRAAQKSLLSDIGWVRESYVREALRAAGAVSVQGEPEWEYRYAEVHDDGSMYTYGPQGNPNWSFPTIEAARAEAVEESDVIVRRTKAGPWVPVQAPEGEEKR